VPGKHTIMIADDEAAIRNSLAELFRDQGFEVVCASDGQEAVRHLQETHIDVALLDIRMPALDGLAVLAKAQEVAPDAQIIMITAFGTVEDAVDAIKRGACDYVSKPLSFDDLLIKVERLLRLRRLASQNTLLLKEVEGRYGFRSIVGKSPALQSVLQLALKLSNTRTTSLLYGESGTGKEVVARAIHFGGITGKGRFVAINCAALPESLVESELFGHRRGAFTGADRDSPGLFLQADGGTIFLDEISSMPLPIQAKLLRAIEEKRVTPVGGGQPVAINARILCATNRELRAEVEAGRFREDLYYRLNVFEVRIPPLRQRRDDIPLLVEHFVARYRAELKHDCPGVSDGAMQALMAYPWPGNVRELENAIERALIFADGRPILPRDLAFVTGIIAQEEDPAPTDLRDALRAYERQHIVHVLRRHDYDKNKAARSLGIGLSSLYRKIDDLAIDAHAEAEADKGASRTADSALENQWL
jgi:DNA-binding NtrC family response regulator